MEHGTNEFLAGIEYDINKKFTISCGGQRTDYGLSDEYQQNTSFACDSWSLGLGGACNYQGTPYTGTEIYSRTNHVIGVGIDYKF